MHWICSVCLQNADSKFKLLWCIMCQGWKRNLASETLGWTLKFCVHNFFLRILWNILNFEKPSLYSVRNIHRITKCMKSCFWQGNNMGILQQFLFHDLKKKLKLWKWINQKLPQKMFCENIFFLAVKASQSQHRSVDQSEHSRAPPPGCKTQPRHWLSQILRRYLQLHHCTASQVNTTRWPPHFRSG